MIFGVSHSTLGDFHRPIEKRTSQGAAGSKEICANLAKNDRIPAKSRLSVRPFRRKSTVAETKSSLRYSANEQ
jgi:hypothetical protein